MVETVEYKETIDYTWVIARQLDRVADAMSWVQFHAPGPGVARVYSAVRSLVAVAAPFAPRNAWVRLERSAQLLQRGRPVAALRELELLLGELLRELEKRGLLVRRRALPVGEAEV